MKTVGTILLLAVSMMVVQSCTPPEDLADEQQTSSNIYATGDEVSIPPDNEKD
ncbi:MULTISPECIES: hypothetical protein [Galbibacter]|uniref:Secreted protein n=1 Tax=Galbibacter pacificus TaxID=2996052 RepID=A0ABT6FN77_9FLAO|nr:hypothetical protein [Galbibacter pacificus]MDG3581238.1 hypothetical protein [Galbibacter pacificus]MDG3584716.1 hypothetical protein [Galbibacter pacificus]